MKSKKLIFALVLSLGFLAQVQLAIAGEVGQIDPSCGAQSDQTDSKLGDGAVTGTQKPNPTASPGAGVGK